MPEEEQLQKTQNDPTKDLIRGYVIDILQSLQQIQLDNLLTSEQIQKIIQDSLNEQKEKIIAQLMDQIAQLEQEKNQFKQKNIKLKQLLKEFQIKVQEQLDLKFGDISSIQNGSSNNQIQKNKNVGGNQKSNNTNELISQFEVNSQAQQKFSSELISEKVCEQKEKLKLLSIQLSKYQTDLQKVEAQQQQYKKIIQAQKDKIDELEYEKNNLLVFIKSMNKLDQSIVGQELVFRAQMLLQNQPIKLNQHNQFNSKQIIQIKQSKVESFETKLSSSLSFTKDINSLIEDGFSNSTLNQTKNFFQLTAS